MRRGLIFTKLHPSYAITFVVSIGGGGGGLRKKRTTAAAAALQNHLNVYAIKDKQLPSARRCFASCEYIINLKKYIQGCDDDYSIQFNNNDVP